jgi:hypothetical protein
MAMKKKPQGKFAAGKVEAPRKVTINGETHYLVYVTPEEAKGLKKAGGSGQAGPKGIPAYPVGSVNKEKVDRAKAKMASKPAPKPKPAPSGGSYAGQGSGASGPAGGAGNSSSSGGGNNNSGGGGGGGGSDSGQANNPPPSGGNNNNNNNEPNRPPVGTGNGGSNNTSTPRPPTPRPPTPNDNDNGPTAAEKAAAAAKVQALADKAIRDQIESDRAAQLARDQKQLAEDKLNAEKSKAAMARLLDNPVYARLETITDETQTAPVFTPNILDAQTDDDLGLTSSPLAGTAATTATTATADTNTVVADPKVVTNTVVAPKDTGVAAVKTEVPFKGTMKDGVLLDRLGNPVVTNAKGYGYLDPLTGLAVTPWTDSINGGGPGYGGAAFGSGGGAALDTNKDNYISEAEIAAGKAKGLELEQNAWSKFGTGLGITPLGSGIDPTGIAGLADPSFIRKLGRPGYTRPDSSIAPGQELNKWWEADKNALGFAYGTQDEISQRRADAVRAAAAAAAVPERNNDNDNGPVAPTVPTVTTPPTYTENASSPFAPIPNPNYNPADPMSLAYLTNPSYEELLAYRNSGTVPARPFAKGGIANLVKDGGNEKTIISDAIRAVEGKMSERDAAISLAKFVKAHGEPALRDLVDKVSSGEYADTRERFANGENGMVRGPGNGSGTDDKVPATIDGEQDVLLADGEMVLRKKTTDAIEKAYPGLLDRINAAEGDAPKVLAKALDFIEGRNRRG